jgi:hypothetical protein
LVALLVLAPAVAIADDELDIPGLDAADLRGDALVWEDATFYSDPWESPNEKERASFHSVIRRREEVGRAVPVRIVDSSMKTFVEVELPGRSDCTWRRLDADRRIEGLRLFVRREDLAPVLVKPFAAQYTDGTRVRLAIGAPVMPTASGDYLVAARNDRFRLSIPHGSVGYVYKPGKITEPEPPPGKLVRIDRNTNAKLGDETFAVRSNWIGPVPDKKTDVALVHWSTRCLDMVVSVPANTLRATEPMRSPSYPTHSPPAAASTQIPSGAPLSTSSGREIAVASTPIAVPPPVPGTSKVCFDARFALVREDETYATQNRTLRLCAPASLLEP